MSDETNYRRRQWLQAVASTAGLVALSGPAVAEAPIGDHDDGGGTSHCEEDRPRRDYIGRSSAAGYRRDRDRPRRGDIGRRRDGSDGDRCEGDQDRRTDIDRGRDDDDGNQRDRDRGDRDVDRDR